MTIIGGLAVWELVDPAYRTRSRDVDLVLQSDDAVTAFSRQFRAWGIRWRTRGTTVYKECCFVDAPDHPPAIDVFTTDLRIGEKRFAMQKARNVEPAILGQPFVPDLRILLDLKIRTIPSRRGSDAIDKRAKDLLDVHRLAFHNAAQIPPLDLLPASARGNRLRAAGFVAEAVNDRSEYRTEYEAVDRWLRRE